MIDTIYKVLLTILNKENQGYVSPEEYNLIANNVQNEIFRYYFEEENLDKNKENRGLTNSGYSNLSFNQRQRITQFASNADITAVNGLLTLPTDIYLIEDNGVSTSSGILIEEVERNSIITLNRTEAKPTMLYPVYENYGKTLKIYPNTITDVNIRYIRKPLEPKWTYSMVANKEMFNPSNTSFQDFELHPSEFSNIVLRMLVLFGINLREAEVTQIAEILKDKMNLKDNQ